MKSAKSGGRGRPREFDTDKALDAAMRVFWEKGYDGASLSDLTRAMGISKPSMYHSLGNKEALFEKAMERYAEMRGVMLTKSFAAVNAREGINRLLRAAVEMFTEYKNPRGCLANQGISSCSTGSPGLRRDLEELRDSFELAMKERFDLAQETGELDSHISTKDLARYYSVVFQGLGLQAKGGGTRKELLRIVDLAIENGPLHEAA
jgi:AcrR family transcriptional regulator